MERFKKWSFMAPALAGAAAIAMSLGLLLRQFWFDEALTIMEFMSHPLHKIYLYYDIPNNHILFTIVLKLWVSFQNLLGPVPEFSFRIPSIVFAALAAAILCGHSFRRTGRDSSLLCVILLVSSCPFAIFATAVRGYMMGLLLCVLALKFGDDWRRSGRTAPLALHFLACLLAVGTVPTNILALEAVAVLFAPCPFSDRRKVIRAAWLAAAPFVCLVIFYLPIAPKFIHSLTLGEGWSSSLRAAWNLYGSFLTAFLPLLPFCAAGAWRIWRRIPRLRWRLLLGLCVFAIPLPPIFLLHAAPFPRVFFPLWGIWTFILSYALSGYLRSGNGRTRLVALVMLVCVWIPVQFHGRQAISGFLFGEVEDDLLSPRYMSPSFTPWKVANFMRSRLDEAPAEAFISFDADPFSVLIYGKYFNVPEAALLYDSPRRGPLPGLNPGVRNFIVCAGDAEIEALARRFKAKSLGLALDAGIQKIYEIRPASP